MHKIVLAAAGLASAAVASSASAGIMGAHVEVWGTDLGGLTGTTTYRVYVDLDNPLDQLYAIAGDADYAALSFAADSPLVQNQAIPGPLGDIPGMVALDGDSWVSIGDPATHNTAFSPDFLNGDGVTSIIAGSTFMQADNGGYYDNNPATAEVGGSVLIAQFTLANGSGFDYSGTANWRNDGETTISYGTFAVSVVPAPGALALLGLAGLAGRRRRG